MASKVRLMKFQQNFFRKYCIISWVTPPVGLSKVVHLCECKLDSKNRIYTRGHAIFETVLTNEAKLANNSDF